MGFFSGQLLEIAARDEQDRKARMDRAWAAYYGRVPDLLKVKAGQPDDNVKINKSRVVVDKGVSFLFGDDLTIKLADDDRARGEDPDRPNPAQVWLDACLAANKLPTLLHKLAMNGGVCGQAVLKILPAGAGIDGTFPRLVIVDPATVSVVWAPDDIDTVVRYTIQYSAIDPQTSKPVNVRQIVERAGDGWTSVDQRSDPDSSVWKTVSTVAWPHPYPPIIDCQNLPVPNEYWGMSDIEDDVLGLNTAASFTLSNSQRIIRFHASPKTVAKGLRAGEIDVSVDNVIALPNPDASLENLEMQHDLAATIQQYERICEAIHEVARIPAISTGTLENLGQLSGVALTILYQPLLEKTRTKQQLYGDLLVELCRRLLDLAGHGPANVATITWPKLLPTDPLQERQADLLEDQMGVVSKQTISERLGNDWETEKQRMAEEKADAVADAQAALGPGQPGQPGQGDPSGQVPPTPLLNARAVPGMKPEG